MSIPKWPLCVIVMGSLVMGMLALAARCALAADISGRVIGSTTGEPLTGAFVTLGDTVVRADDNGMFHIRGEGRVLGVRAYGHRRKQIPISSLAATDNQVALDYFRPKALYLSFYGIGSRTLRESALALIRSTELNALVIDVKGDRGMIAYRSAIPLASQVGAQSVITIADLPGLVKGLHDQGIYTIARIVVFKDNPLATARPDLAVRYAGGGIYHDREHLAWADPFSKEVWDYNIAVAVEAARAGFDEIQFDYVRLPDARGLRYQRPWTLANRVSAIDGFLSAARRALVPYNVFLGVDIFGYVIWNLDDTKIGQMLPNVVGIADYVCPMLYPSGFQFGIPGYRNPVQHPYEIVHLSLMRAIERTGVPAVRFRPWIQAFRDYAFSRQQFGGVEIRKQIDAAERAGADGWMLWNPNNRYSEAGLKLRRP
ncbi:MAG TPA: putative glycoside hydrolase [Candidatus Binataceae bacterium]|nr:putative glycoside hydrolase [Candidatus Binataceae bacterium]